MLRKNTLDHLVICDIYRVSPHHVRRFVSVLFYVANMAILLFKNSDFWNADQIDMLC